MESSVNTAVSSCLDLTYMQGAIVCSNMQLRDKLNLLKTVVNSFYTGDEATKQKYSTALENIKSLSATRNMFAHTMFAAAPNDSGVQFFVTKAKGKFQLPTTIWDWQRFSVEYTEIIRLTLTIEEFEKSLHAPGLKPPTTFQIIEIFARAARQSTPSTETQDPPAPLPQDILD